MVVQFSGPKNVRTPPERSFAIGTRFLYFFVLVCFGCVVDLSPQKRDPTVAPLAQTKIHVCLPPGRHPSFRRLGVSPHSLCISPNNTSTTIAEFSQPWIPQNSNGRLRNSENSNGKLRNHKESCEISMSQNIHPKLATDSFPSLENIGPIVEFNIDPTALNSNHKILPNFVNDKIRNHNPLVRFSQKYSLISLSCIVSHQNAISQNF